MPRDRHRVAIRDAYDLAEMGRLGRHYHEVGRAAARNTFRAVNAAAIAAGTAVVGGATAGYRYYRGGPEPDRYHDAYKAAAQDMRKESVKEWYRAQRANSRLRGAPVDPVYDYEVDASGNLVEPADAVNVNEVTLGDDEDDDNLIERLPASQSNTMSKTGGGGPTSSKGSLTTEEKKRHLGFSERAGVGLKAKATQVGRKLKRRKTNGYLVDYMEAAMLPFYRSKTYGIGTFFGVHHTVGGVESYQSPSDDVISLAFEGNRQLVGFGEFFLTEGVRAVIRNALGMRAQSTATNMLPMFGLTPDDDVPTTVVALDAEVNKDRFCITNRMESVEYNITVNITNMSLNISNCDIYIFQSVDYHSTSFQVTQARESADYNYRLNAANSSLVAEDKAEKVQPNMGYTHLYWKPYVGKHTDKYWKMVSKRKVALGAVQTVSVVLNGPLGVVPLRKLFMNANEDADGIPGSTTSSTDELYTPYSYAMCIVCQGGELAGDASAATNVGTCAGVISFTTDHSTSVRLLPNMEAVKPMPILPAQRPFILEANVRTISTNAITWKNPDDVTS